MSKGKFTRHEIREKALQALFPLDVNRAFSEQDAIRYVLTLSDRKSSEENEAEALFVPDYLNVLVAGVCTEQEKLDALIAKHLKAGWRLARISKVDLIILRLALFEMTEIPDVPRTVVLNEAIELAKKYSDDQSRKFINGILSHVMQELDQTNE